MNAETNKPEPTKPEKTRLTKGGRNLVLLGIGATLIAFSTTFIALKIYHDSGDIYLDRSRPGFLPEKEEAEADKDPANFEFKDSGAITEEVIDEYLDNLKQEINRLNDFSAEPFSPAPLSNEALGF